MSDTLDIAPPQAAPRPKPGLLDISPYVGGKAKAEGFEHPLKLSSNENILGSSVAASNAYASAGEQMHLYPDGRCESLRAAVAAKYDLEPQRLIFGCGSDELFTLLCQVYCEPGDNVVQGQYGFLAYRIAARAAQAQVRFAPEPRFKLDVDEVLRHVDERTRVVFVANPANPTGAWNTRAEITRLHSGLPGGAVLCLDGAYAEFVDDPHWCDGLDRARGAANVIATRTFSKAYGLAGLRVGWGYAPVAIIDAMDRIRAPFKCQHPRPGGGACGARRRGLPAALAGPGGAGTSQARRGAGGARAGGGAFPRQFRNGPILDRAWPHSGRCRGGACGARRAGARSGGVRPAHRPAHHRRSARA